MFWDIVLPVLAAIAQGLTGFLGWRVTVDGVRQERRKVYEWLFAVASFVGIVSVGIAAYRGSQISRDLAAIKQGQQTTNAGIQEIKTTPAPTPVVNVNPPTINFPAQQAFMTLTDRALTKFKLDDPIEVTFTTGNLNQQVPALNEYGQQGLYVVEARQIGLNKEWMVTPEVEDKQYATFLSSMSKLGHSTSTKTYGPGEKDFSTAFGPTLDATMEKEIENGNKAIFQAVRYVWQDGGGTHENEVCQWLQPQSFKGTLQVWHYCQRHNGEIQKR